MLTEQNYYEVENDMFKRRMTRKVKGTDVEETYKLITNWLTLSIKR